MPRMQIYLPDDLYRAVKARELPASELLQEAVRAELHRQEILEETEHYLDDLVKNVGNPTPGSVARAENLSSKVRRRSTGAKAS